MYKTVVSLVILALLAAHTYGANECTLPDGNEGVCIKLLNCAAGKHLVQNKNFWELKNRTCGYSDKDPVICCEKSDTVVEYEIPDRIAVTAPALLFPTAPPPAAAAVAPPKVAYSTTPRVHSPTPFTPNRNFNYNSTDKLSLLPSRSICGSASVSRRILNGNIAGIDEIPWMARIRYLVDGNKLVFACAGSLISNRYVVTAAHCLRLNNFTTIHSVRLGEWDTETERDCTAVGCNNGPLDIGVEEEIIHEGFSLERFSINDIALLRLSQTVTFTNYITPICLPTSEYIAGMDYGEQSTYTISGWGKTENAVSSPVLRKLQIKAVKKSICRVAVPLLPAEVMDKVICAGGRINEDSCAGDSGGPLFMEASENYTKQFFLYGVISYGPKVCGSEGIPGIYTRVTSHLNWILNHLRP